MDGVNMSAPATILYVQLLGGFRIRVGSHIIEETDWPLRKAKALVKRLALMPEHRMPGGQVMDLLWPELGGRDGARNALNRTLSAARRILDPDGKGGQPLYLRMIGGVLELFPRGTVQVDALSFEAACASARKLHDVAALRAALALYTGDLLPMDSDEDEYDQWITNRRESLRSLHLGGLLDMARLTAAQGAIAEAIAALRELLTADPVHEEAHAQLIRLHLQTGDPYEARRQYQQMRDTLQRELGVAPDAESLRLYAEIQTSSHSGEPVLAAAPDSSAPKLSHPARRPQHDDPSEPHGTRRMALDRRGSSFAGPFSSPSSFIGREDEQAQVRALLAATRLLTLIGAGGCGKTRLAMHVAFAPSESHRSPVWLVELAAITNPSQVLPHAAATLGVREEPHQSLHDTLIRVLRSKRALLVLDNCEHVREAAAQLARTLLDNCPRLQILATSRRALGVPGESTWRVPSMRMPDPEHLPPFASLMTYDAIRLFVERARASRAGFMLTTENAATVVSICHRLAGIPLAIELAAGRRRFMTEEQIAQRLDTCFVVLGGGGPDVLPRQQTLRAAIDWSYALLTNPERLLFQRLAVFNGGCTLEAVEAICVEDGVESDKALDLLGALVQQSLVEVEERDGESRYYLHEPIRQYAEEKLEASGELARLRARHATWNLTLAESAEPHLNSPERTAWRVKAEREYANLRAALRWTRDQEEIEAGLRLATALWRFWYSRGMLSEGTRWLENLLALGNDGSQIAPSVWANALYAAGQLALLQGDFRRAEERAEQSLAVARTLGDTQTTMLALMVLGGVAEYQGDYERAAISCDECLRLAYQLGEPWHIAVALSNRADVEWARGNVEAAAALYSECLVVARAHSLTRSLAMALTNVGRVALVQGKASLARHYLEESLESFRAQKDERGMAEALVNLGTVFRMQGDLANARASYVEALVHFQQAGYRSLAVACLEGLAYVSQDEGKLPRAIHLLAVADALREHVGVVRVAGDQLGYEQRLAALRGTVDDEVFRQAWARGRSQSLEEVLTELGSAEKVTRASARSPDASRGAARATLTKREREVIELLARGHKDRDIAAVLGIGVRTAEKHVSTIFAKLGVKSRAEAILWAASQTLTCT